MVLSRDSQVLGSGGDSIWNRGGGSSSISIPSRGRQFL
ncbi:hypothetical protein AALP_AA1G163300 [Arabis alpina]|uniref:Uncharacterized protein n=1 Tax=Arabis alpina TaxID=50452 RepID=A0A087HNL2_ARAAL|nr:hypothetical protein AALP_AA1G163300 [Arabis alpina]